MAQLRRDSHDLPFYEPTTTLLRVYFTTGGTGTEAWHAIEQATSRQAKDDLILDYREGDTYVAVWPGRTRSDAFDVTTRVAAAHEKMTAVRPLTPAPAPLALSKDDIDDLPFD